MNVFNPPPLPGAAKLPDPAQPPWQPRQGDPATGELHDRIARQSQRIDMLEKLLAPGEVVKLEARLPTLPARVAAAERAVARSSQYWPEKPMPAHALEPSPGGRCFQLKDSGAKVIAFAVFGLAGAELENEVARVAEQQARQGNFIPIFLTDAQETDAFRNRG